MSLSKKNFMSFKPDDKSCMYVIISHKTHMYEIIMSDIQYDYVG